MECIEKIPVYINIVKGKTICICHVSAKGCNRPCPKDTVSRDRFEEWEKTMKRDKYGK